MQHQQRVQCKEIKGLAKQLEDSVYYKSSSKTTLKNFLCAVRKSSCSKFLFFLVPKIFSVVKPCIFLHRLYSVGKLTMALSKIYNDSSVNTLLGIPEGQEEYLNENKEILFKQLNVSFKTFCRSEVVVQER